MNDLVFEGIVSDVERSEFENRYHEAVDQVSFTVTEDEGLHPYRQSHWFVMYGERLKQYDKRVYDGARVRVHFAFNGVTLSQTGKKYNRIGVWSVELLTVNN